MAKPRFDFHHYMQHRLIRDTPAGKLTRALRTLGSDIVPCFETWDEFRAWLPSYAKPERVEAAATIWRQFANYRALVEGGRAPVYNSPYTLRPGAWWARPARVKRDRDRYAHLRSVAERNRAEGVA